MNQQSDRWLLPVGIDELLPEQAASVEFLRREILNLFGCWGYDFVAPPHLEYLSSLLTGTSEDLAENVFKLVDPHDGRLLGIRADITPQVARIDAHRLPREGVSRLCYQGTVLRTVPEKLGGSRNLMQVGAELFGCSGAEGDLEVLSLMLDMLGHCNVGAVVLDLGHVGFFRSLVDGLSLDDGQVQLVFDMVQRKALSELAEFLDEGVKGKLLSKHEAEVLQVLPSLSGGPEVFEKAEAVFKSVGGGVLSALAELQQLVVALQSRFDDVSFHVDLAELRGFQYHTGVVFSAFHRESGDVLAQGGRYDNVGAFFGRARPATGFSADLKLLASLCQRSVADGVRLLAPAVDDPALFSFVQSLRREGKQVVVDLEGVLVAEDFSGVVVQENGQWLVKV